MSDIVAIGGGQASFSFLNKLRSLGYNKSITLICSEAELPYQRPPLSKKFLVGEFEKSRLFFRPQNFYDANNIEIIKGQKVLEIDRKNSIVKLEKGSSIDYQTLFLGLGSKPRLLSKELISGISNIYYLRNLDNAKIIAGALKKNKKLLILGGGFIGLEVASVARKVGLEVTLIESQERILKRVSSGLVASHLKKIHIKHGVDIKENIIIKKILTHNKKFCGVLTNNNEEIFADFLIAGIGVEPNTKIAKDSGLIVNNGIVVNDYCQTNDKKIYAAGDCVSFKFHNNLIRLESVGNAIEQSEVAAENILGKNSKYQPIPWFWSDQYNLKLQIAGLNTGFTNVFHRRDNDKNSFWYYRRDKLISIDSINDPVSYMVGKKFLEINKNPDPKDIVSIKIDLKKLLREIK